MKKGVLGCFISGLALFLAGLVFGIVVIRASIASALSEVQFSAETSGPVMLASGEVTLGAGITAIPVCVSGMGLVLTAGSLVAHARVKRLKSRRISDNNQ